MTPTDPTTGPVEIICHEEQADIKLNRVSFRSVRIHRRIITEIRQIEVEVRSEVLDIDWQPADQTDPGTEPNPERLEFVLHGEVPEIRLVTVPRERVILTRVNVAGTTDVHAELRSERISIDTPNPTSPERRDRPGISIR